MNGLVQTSAPSTEVRLRPVRPEDRPRFLEWLQEPEVRRHYLGIGAAGRFAGDLDWVPGHASTVRGAGRPAIGTARPAGHMVRAIDTADGILLGWIELRDVNWRRRSGELRICLGDPRTWGCGYGTAAIRLFLDQAFSVWGLRGVHLRVATWNERAIRAYERCGFRREARLCAGRRSSDGLEDLLLMTAEAGGRRVEAAGSRG